MRHRRTRRHTPVDPRLGSHHHQITQRVSTKGERDRQVRDDLARVVDAERLPPPCQTRPTDPIPTRQEPITTESVDQGLGGRGDLTETVGGAHLGLFAVVVEQAQSGDMVPRRKAEPRVTFHERELFEQLGGRGGEGG